MKQHLDQNGRINRAEQPARDALVLHPKYRGKIQTMPKCPITALEDFAIWYTPGVAAPSRAIAQNRELSYEHTNRGNCIAIVSDGTRVLGLGNIGPEAAMPVMEGKALLFKYLGGVDAVPLCVRTEDPDSLVELVTRLEPSFGGVNLEDIAHPVCFQVLDRLRETMEIPVWHDDQQGTATVVLAALENALQVVGKQIDNIKIAMIGMGAANVAVYRLLRSRGVDAAAVVACDSKGILHRGRNDIERQQDCYRDKWRVCSETNPDNLQGGIDQALRSADVCVSFSCSGPGVIRADWVQAMNEESIVFACANPVPEIWPWEAREAGAKIVATGRSDFPNQVNNSLAFPGIFRGALDVRARSITDEMTLAASREIGTVARERGLGEECIVPRMDERDLPPRVATVTALKAIEQGIARLSDSREQLYDRAVAIIRSARESTEALMEKGLIEPRDRRQE